MKQKLLTSGLVLGLALAAGSLAAWPSTRSSSHDVEKKEVACEVCGKKVNKADAVKVNLNGKEHFVCSEACAKELSANPDKYVKNEGEKKP